MPSLLQFPKFWSPTLMMLRNGLEALPWEEDLEQSTGRSGKDVSAAGQERQGMGPQERKGCALDFVILGD